MEKQVNVQEFCKKYSGAAHDALREKMIRDVVYRTYAPIKEKLRCADIFVSMAIKEKDGIKYVDKLSRYMNYHISILSLYTSFSLHDGSDGGLNITDDYDALKSIGILDCIIEYIGDDVTKELTQIFELTAENYTEQNMSLPAIISQQVTRIGTVAGSFAEPGLSKLADVMQNLDENKVKKLIEKFMKNLSIAKTGKGIQVEK